MNNQSLTYFDKRVTILVKGGRNEKRKSEIYNHE